MQTYGALLRGIMPTNPNMRNAKLKAVFESLGLKNVTPVIASGNIVFQSASRKSALLETKLEQVIQKQLDFTTTVIIRSHEELLKLIKSNPFKDIEDKKPNYLVVTFFQDRRKELCKVINVESNKTPGFMCKVEKKYGKKITTRTWKTVGRILKVMEGMMDKNSEM